VLNLWRFGDFEHREDDRQHMNNYLANCEVFIWVNLVWWVQSLILLDRLEVFCFLVINISFLGRIFSVGIITPIFVYRKCVIIQYYYWLGQRVVVCDRDRDCLFPMTKLTERMAPLSTFHSWAFSDRSWFTFSCWNWFTWIWSSIILKSMVDRYLQLPTALIFMLAIY